MNAEQIKNARTRLKLSQEDLAERIGVSVRTLQRIEKGESEPRFDVRNKMAEILCLEPIESVVEQQHTDNSRTLHWINLSALAYWLVPTANFFLPLIMYFAFRNRLGSSARALVKNIIWSQLIFLLIFGAMFGISLASVIGHFWQPESLIASFMTLGIAQYVANTLLVVFWLVKINREEGSQVLAF